MEVEELLKRHENLGEQLVKIPSKRTIFYREDMEEGGLIGKPRFDPPLYEWEPKLLASLRDHLQDIFTFFKTYSFWFDNDLKEILLTDTRRLSKKSILFLLERDIWETDEIFGGYLIDQKETKISYYRFYHKFKTFTFRDIDKKFREKWICRDAIHQIQEQFRLVWKKLEIEILTCQGEIYHRPIPLHLTDEDLKAQYIMCKELLIISKEAALLMLGRLEEWWVLNAIGRTRIKKEEQLFVLAESKGAMDKTNKYLFLKIRRHYNQLKHITTYNIDNCDVKGLIREFGQYLKKSTKE
ncbi:hypothetical protein ES703_103499 [subsurface metagenome]